MKSTGVITLFIFGLLLQASWPATAVESESRPPEPPLPTGISSPHVHNLFRVATNIYSGATPDGEAAFAELARLGVRTILSVDGSRPDVEMARKHGLRYVHLPIGYDGVSTQRMAELAATARSSSGSIYVHCHDGLHRGPAAVAVICEASAGWTTNQAVAWLHQAGTAPEYAGLYRSAVTFRPPDAAAIARVSELPEVARTSSLVDTMVAIDAEFDRLKAAQKTDWKSVPHQPDVAPAHTATILWEHLRELTRSDDTAGRAEDYRAKLSVAEQAAGEFRARLRHTDVNAGMRDTAFQALGQACGACHRQYRN